jgi:hypothetical protein
MSIQYCVGVMVFPEGEIDQKPGNPAFGHRLQMLAKGVDGPIRLIGCRVNERPCLLDEFDQTALESQPLALERIGLASTLSPDLADQAKKRRFVHAAI